MPEVRRSSTTKKACASSMIPLSQPSRIVECPSEMKLGVFSSLLVSSNDQGYSHFSIIFRMMQFEDRHVQGTMRLEVENGDASKPHNPYLALSKTAIICLLLNTN
ncbi:hypothetical protein YC2023_004783 [Brassica napus]